MTTQTRTLAEVQADLALLRQEEARALAAEEARRRAAEAPRPERLSTYDFDLAHGGDPYHQVLFGNDVLFPDGWYRDRSDMLYRRLSKEGHGRCRLLCEYWQVRLSWTKRDFTAIKTFLDGKALQPNLRGIAALHLVPTDIQNDGLATLKFLADLHQTQTQTLEQAKADLAATPEAQEEAEKQQAEAAWRRREEEQRAALRADLARITI